ncbi:MAG: PadR family transcriptional regulator [Candidatus Sericytochromatia bacterium]
MTEDTLTKWLSQVRRGSLELCILGLVEHQENYAFAMIQALGQLDGFILTEGAIYPLLKRLQSEGLVDSYWVESDSGPPRKYYRLTPHGRTMLARMRAEWLKFSRFVTQILERTPADDAAIERSQPAKIPLEVKEAASGSAPE